MLHDPATYAYALGTLYFTGLFIVIFILYRPLRNEMLGGAGIGFAMAPVVQLAHEYDWWSPLYVFALPMWLQPENYLFGAAVGGVTAAIWQVFSGRIYQSTIPPKTQKYLKLFAAYLVACGSFLALVFSVGVHSFYAALILVGLVVVTTFIKRPDLWCTMLFTGLITPSLALPFYLLGLYANPLWIEQVWQMHNLSGHLLFGVPIEEFIWFAAAGAAYSGFWKYFDGLRPR